MGTLCKVLCCGMAALLVKPSHDLVMERKEEKGEPQEQEMNLLHIGEDLDTCKTAGLIGVEETAEPAEGSMN